MNNVLAYDRSCGARNPLAGLTLHSRGVFFSSQPQVSLVAFEESPSNLT